MKIRIEYEYNAELSTYCAEAQTVYGVIRGSSWDSFYAAKQQVLMQVARLQNRPSHAPEEVEI